MLSSLGYGADVSQINFNNKREKNACEQKVCSYYVLMTMCAKKIRKIKRNIVIVTNNTGNWNWQGKNPASKYIKVEKTRTKTEIAASSLFRCSYYSDSIVHIPLTLNFDFVHGHTYYTDTTTTHTLHMCAHFCRCKQQKSTIIVIGYRTK